MSGGSPVWPNPSPQKADCAVRRIISLISPKTEFFNKIGGKETIAASPQASEIVHESSLSEMG
jgi:hypothetical protein